LLTAAYGTSQTSGDIRLESAKWAKADIDQQAELSSTMGFEGGNDMQAIGEDDPEMAYRRGYENGAVHMLQAVERFLDPATRAAMRAWIDVDIYQWRHKAMLNQPPTWRLTVLAMSQGSRPPT
jgi:hypothetical protein